MDPSMPSLVFNFHYCSLNENLNDDVSQDDFTNYVEAFPQNQAIPVPIHAPVPVSGTTPQVLQNDFPVWVNYQNQRLEEPLFFSHDGYQQHDALQDVCPPIQPPSVKMEFTSHDAVQPTFPTPSELLAELSAKGMPVTSDEFGSDVRSESASKARRRAMAKKVGFVPTDPDTISSHDKKRHYIECLEQYILYLHKQFEGVEADPVPLERVGFEAYHGLSSKSIRTLLVHMQNTTKTLNERTLAEEQKFMRLRDEVQRRQSMGSVCIGHSQ